MKTPNSVIHTGLTVKIGNVLLCCVIDEAAKTARVVQRGETLNGDAGAIEKAATLLAGRLRRVRPELTVIE